MRHFIEVGIDESDAALEGFAGKVGCAERDHLTNLEEGEVRLSGAEHEPHFGEIGDFEHFLALLHKLTFRDVTFHNDSGQGREDAEIQVVRLTLWNGLDLFPDEAVLLQASFGNLCGFGVLFEGKVVVVGRA